jgi:hypothetical protein
VFAAFAVAGQVLPVDALAELGHAAESARRDAMRTAASPRRAGTRRASARSSRRGRAGRSCSRS